jgi:glycosyltransferase involved in cell wall biosynthesis
MPTVSILLPFYNARRYLAGAARSMLAQTFEDFELLLMDDGSSDGSKAIADELAATDPRVRVISGPNKGRSRTLNEGIALAQGEFIARMDADDLSLPTRLQRQVEYLREHPECVCVGTRVTLIDPYDSPLSTPEHKLTHDEIDAELLRGIGWAIVHPAATMRTDAVRRVGGYRAQFNDSEDLDLFLRLGEVGRLANLPEPLVQYRQHFESASFVNHEGQWNQKARIITEAYERRGLQVPQQWDFNRRTPLPIVEQLKRWAWAALKHGNVNIARKHAAQVVRRAPFSTDSWRVMYCAIRGR